MLLYTRLLNLSNVISMHLKLLYIDNAQILPLSVLCWCQIKVFLENSVKAAQRSKSAVACTLNYWRRGIFQKIASVAQAVMIYVGIKGHTDIFLEISGKR